MDLYLKDIGQFIGTEQYHRGWLDTNLTDGVFYICENGYSWFVTDAISVIKTLDYIMEEEFLAIKLHIDKIEQREDNGIWLHKATMRIEDGNGKLLYAQQYDYTNCCYEKDLVLFFTDNVLMLASEY